MLIRLAYSRRRDYKPAFSDMRALYSLVISDSWSLLGGPMSLEGPHRIQHADLPILL